MTKLELFGEWINFVLKSKNAHGIHSPFVYNFYNFCLKGSVSNTSKNTFRQVRKELLANNQLIYHQDLGAGSKVNSNPNLPIKQLAKASLKKEKEAGMIAKSINFLKCKKVVELGTSFGSTTLLCCLENPDIEIHTIEGSPEVAQIASELFSRFHKNNIHLITGSFEEKLPPLLSQINTADTYIFDGNHRQEATLNYFGQALQHSNKNTVFIFDDIRWSSEMLNAWKTIEKHPEVTLSLDLFSMGIAFINTDFSKQNLKLRRY